MKRIRELLIDWLVNRAKLRDQRTESRVTGRMLGLPTAGWQKAEDEAIQAIRMMRFWPPDRLERAARDAERADATDVAEMLRDWAQEAKARGEPSSDRMTHLLGAEYVGPMRGR